jgi:CTP:molybdopterin cytidylyltransferase MocA
VTVAAIVLAASPDSALADADGMPSARRIADVAWSGGATPIVVVTADPDGAVAAAMAGSPVTLAQPAPAEQGPAGQMAQGVRVAVTAIHETDAAILWPARYTWVGPETITSLIEAHGIHAGRLIRPTFSAQPGWPVLLPVDHLGALAAVGADRMPDDLLADLVKAGVQELALELGDPGTAHDRSVPRSQLPPYQGPTEPVGHAHEWGAMAADAADDGPLEGPALAPYGQAADEDADQAG